MLDNIILKMQKIGIDCQPTVVLAVAAFVVLLLLWLILWLVFRKLRLWYWKIDRQEASLASIDGKLDALRSEIREKGLCFAETAEAPEVSEPAEAAEAPEVPKVLDFPDVSEAAEPAETAEAKEEIGRTGAAAKESAISADITAMMEDIDRELCEGLTKVDTKFEIENESNSDTKFESEKIYNSNIKFGSEKRSGDSAESGIYNVGKSGRRYTEEELKALIKD